MRHTTAIPRPAPTQAAKPSGLAVATDSTIIKNIVDGTDNVASEVHVPYNEPLAVAGTPGTIS
jgi:hypothetical protein